MGGKKKIIDENANTTAPIIDENAEEIAPTTTENSKIPVKYIGKNASYTIGGIRFNKTGKAVMIEKEIAQKLIQKGKFIETSFFDFKGI